MPKKIRIAPGFASPKEVASELGMSVSEWKTVDQLLNQPPVRKKSAKKRNGGLVAKKASSKAVKPTGKQSPKSASKTIWQLVQASRRNAKSTTR